MPDVELVTVADRPDLIPTIAAWIWREWGEPAGCSLAEETGYIAGWTARLGPDQGFVLLCGDAPVATAALVAHDLDARPDLGPWLASLYVLPPHRGRGHSLRLIRRVEETAAAAGIETLWLHTNTAASLYAKLGWQAAGESVVDGVPVTLFRKSLNLAAPPRVPVDR